MPLEAINDEIQIAINEKGADSIAARLSNNSIPFGRNGDIITLSNLTLVQRKQLGKIAKEHSWYKRIGLGEQFGTIVLNNWDTLDDQSAIKRVVTALSEWVIKDDSART